jgi:lipopolysaccharide/colanic/teichoic acid biosynthesis glycosyltransferase
VGETSLKRERQKRLVDLTLGMVVAVLALPVIGVLAIGAAVSLRAWPFFVQPRLGRASRVFRMVKIRTLPPSTPPSMDKYFVRQVETTRFGRLLRMTHLDELPQLLLIPGGRMSLVGPRPEMPELAGTIDPGFMAARTAIRPGCTGLWQVSADAGKLIAESPEYDLFYLRRGGLRLDLWILWRTIWSFLPWTRRIGSCEDVPAWTLGRGFAHTDAPAQPVPAAELS